MPTITKFTVAPKLPARLARLADIADNLRWCWNHEAIDLFKRVDRDQWSALNHNPRRLLGAVSQVRLEQLASDDSFLAHLDRVVQALDQYLNGGDWRSRHPDAPEDFLSAYFSFEFGLHECLSIYSGGLGLLAGDHLKAASDLGLPLMGMGLMYREGYFRQYLNAEGWQQERYPRNDFYNMPISLVHDDQGAPLCISVPYPGRDVKACVWKCQVGRVPLYLLDCDCDENSPEDRAITGRLYGGDTEMRVRQEIMLGMGGVLATHALGQKPTIWHMNEGHAAFMTLQRIKDIVQADGLSFDQAAEAVKASCTFTTHTPVPAGNDHFEPALVSTYFKNYCKEVGITMDKLLGVGRQNPSDTTETFCMTVLALRLAAGANGVSKLHGEVAREMWQGIWSDVPHNEVPIGSVTNGVHTPTWVSEDMAELFDRYLGPGWLDNPDEPSVWERIHEAPDSELWRTHGRARELLVDFARRRLHAQYKRRGAPSHELKVCQEVLDPEALTIGFARRFATYKRGSLILSDINRLKRILLDSERPVQFILSGKAHPADNAGKHVMRDLFHFARDPEVRHHFIFIEDYDINVARHLVQGVDCWLNTPRRPMEASGTSGMKASANGALNISIPDGWWCEAENLGPNGWSIGQGEMYESSDEQDRVESEALYDILEHEVAPLFYDRSHDNLPRAWIACMKSAIGTINPVFNTWRMVSEYAERYYVPFADRRQQLLASNRKRALALADWKAKIHAAWPEVRVMHVETESSEELTVGAQLHVRAAVALGGLAPADVTVEIFTGDLDHHGQLPQGDSVAMNSSGEENEGVYRFQGTVRCGKTGQQGLGVRVLPNHTDLANKHETTRIAWA